MSTVVGLCFGGGQLGLGVVATFLTVVVLWLVKSAETRLPRKHQAVVSIAVKPPSRLDESPLAGLEEADVRLLGRRWEADQDLRVSRYQVQFGASPRATIFLTLAAKAWALLQGRDYVIPEDVKSIGPDVLRHRIILTYEAEAQAVTTDAIIKKVFNAVPVP